MVRLIVIQTSITVLATYDNESDFTRQSKEPHHGIEELLGFSKRCKVLTKLIRGLKRLFQLTSKEVNLGYNMRHEDMYYELLKMCYERKGGSG